MALVANDPQPTNAPSKSRSAVGLPQCYLPLRSTGEIAGETPRVHHAARQRGLRVSLCKRGGASPQDRVTLFCVATGIVHGSVGITDHAMQSMAIRGFIAHNRESGAYTLTDSGRATLTAILEDAEIAIAPK